MKFFSRKNKKAAQDPNNKPPLPSNGSSSTASTEPRTHGPGAASIPKNTTAFRIRIPEGVSPGEEFQVCLKNNRMVRVRCPPRARSGQSISISVPDEVGTSLTPEQKRAAEAARAAKNRNGNPQQSQENMETTPGVRKAGSATAQGQPYNVPIPQEVRAGQQFPVMIQGEQLMVTCPANARAGMFVRIIAPLPQSNPNASQRSCGTELTRNPTEDAQQRRRDARMTRSQFQTFEVIVPPSVQPGKPFALIAGGQRVLVTCPPNAKPGQRIRFQLPVSMLLQPSSSSSSNKDKAKNKVPSILSYDKDGWARTIRITDMKFQWVRMDSKGDVDLNKRFDPKTSAYVRKIDYKRGTDPRYRSGNVSLVPASDAIVESKIRGADGSELVSYADIASAQNKDFDDKAQWFFETCQNLCVDWNEGHMRINVRREFLLDDSMEAVMSLSRKDLRKTWRFEFIGEEGIDAGGLAREWFNLVSSELFNPERGLWIPSATNQMCMQINPASEIINPDDHLLYYRFVGRIMGKALFDQQLIQGHMVRHMYKHLLGWPVQFDDLALIDEEFHANLKKIWTLSDEEVEYMCLDFSTTEKTFDTVEEFELVENGREIDVTKDNLPEYMEACLKFRLFGRVLKQSTELLLGFFDVIPEPLLTVFDFQELELLMCGLPKIDMDDWKEHTEYMGDFSFTRSRHEVVKWFWEVVEEYDQEFKARLLQFVTGTSGVPSRGFSVLQGNDGNIRKFTIHGVDLATCLYPRAHTCFNRIDLPIYQTKEQLSEKLTLAVQMEATGFGIE